MRATARSSLICRTTLKIKRISRVVIVVHPLVMMSLTASRKEGLSDLNQGSVNLICPHH